MSEQLRGVLQELQLRRLQASCNLPSLRSYGRLPKGFSMSNEREASREAFEKWYVCQTLHEDEPIGSRRCHLQWEAWQARGQQEPLTNARIREIMLAHGFTIKDGLDDLRPYVYEAAHAIEREVNR